MNNVKIKVSGFQNTDGQSEKVFTESFGTAQITEEGYLVKYSEKESEDVPKVYTELLIKTDNTAVLSRSGGIKSTIVIAENKTTECLYTTPIGSLSLDIEGKRVYCRVTEEYGEIYLSYSIGQNGQTISTNEVRINITKEV